MSRAQILSFTDLNHEKLVDVVNKFQDKSGRDKRTKPVFINACKLLHTYLESPERIQVGGVVVNRAYVLFGVFSDASPVFA